MTVRGISSPQLVSGRRTPAVPRVSGTAWLAQRSYARPVPRSPLVLPLSPPETARQRPVRGRVAPPPEPKAADATFLLSQNVLIVWHTLILESVAVEYDETGVRKSWNRRGILLETVARE